ncbi:MAG TPA: DNA repair protein RecO, partial [Enhygromyxa sp.]|nr:DNA repair protein RecO [Enhygromyxa sp.]
TPAVILRTRPLREADLIVVLLTPGRGKIDCIARGARRSRKRFGGGLPVGARGTALLSERGRGSLVPLAGFSPTADHGSLGRSLELFAYVAYLCELTDQLIGGASPDPTAFARLCDAIAAAMEATRPELLRRFELGLLDDLGLLPALAHCSVCGSPIDEQEAGVAFSQERGGALCLSHSRTARRIPVAVLRLAAALLDVDASATAHAYAEADADTRRALRDLCRESIGPHLRGPLHSLGFFAQIARPRSG